MSNRLTFSLASLIVLIALGFVFGTASVMAHTTDPVTDHAHPVITIAEPTDVDDRVDGIQAADSDAVIDDHQVVYTVTFPDIPPLVNPDAVAGDADFGLRVAADNFKATIRTADFLAAPSGMSATVGTPVVDSDNDKMYTVPVTVVFLDVSDPATDVNEIVLNFSCDAGVFASQKVPPHPTTGQSNEKTDAMAVTVLRIAPDRTAPVLTATVGAADATTGAITVTLAFDETFTTAPRVTDLTAATSAIADTYEVGDVAGSGMSFTVTVTPEVTPDAATAESGDIPSGAVTLHVSGRDNDGNAIPARTTVNVRLAARPFTDTVAPEVVILPNPDRQSEAFAISFTATDNYSAATDLTVAVAITPATAVTEAAPTAMAQADGSYKVTVTPVAATEATPTISEQTITVMVTVTDVAKNSGSDREFFFLAERTYTPPPDTTAPTLAVGIGAADATTGAITVPLSFDEALQGVPTVTHAVIPTTLAGTYTVSAVADDGDSTTMNRYTVTVTPSALAVGDSDLPAGTVTLTVSAMDAAGNALAANTTVAVLLAARTAPTDSAPEFPADTASYTLTVDTSVSLILPAATDTEDDAAGTALTYSIDADTPLPDDLDFDADGRVVSGMPTDAGLSTVRYVATDSVNQTDSMLITFTVEPGPTPPITIPDPPTSADPPTFADATVSVPALTVGEPISMGTGTAAKSYISLPLATGGTGDLKYTLWVGLKDITASGYNGLSLDDVNVGLKGTPLAADATGTVFEWRATDAMNLSAKVAFTVVVNEPDDVAPGPGVITAAYDATTMTTTLEGVIAADGFGVISSAALPDLQRFYSEGGSISVLSSKTGAAAKDVVASEIMWGLNLRAIGAARTAHQFIELYNTTSAAIDLADVKLTFDGANTPPAAPTGMTLLDQVSNVSGVGWLISDAPGQSGRIAVPDDVATFVPADLISMYRKINYTRVVSTTLNKDDAADNRKKQLEGVPGGNALGSWAASDAADTYGVNLIGSPGEQHFVPYTVLTPTPVPRGTFIINEIGNHSNDAYDWVEIKRVGGGDNLKNWRLSQVTSDKKDTALVSFPDNDNHKILNVGDVLLIVNSDPYQNPDHPLAAGERINPKRLETTGIKSRYYVDGGLKLANSGKTLLIIRNSVDNGHLGKPNNIQDVVGTLSIVDNAAGLRTKLWPLVATGAPHGDVITDGPPEEFKSGSVYVRNDAAGGTGEHDLSTVGYTGVGYKRSAAKNNQHGGTPGYDNGAVKVNDADLADSAMISISEIMYAKNRNEPQWIELYNSSMTQAINLSEWKLKLEHDRDVADSDIRTSVTTNNLGGGIIIQPNQTVLIVSNTTGRASRASQGAVDFPATRVIDLWAQKDKLEVPEGKNRLTYRLLSNTAFKLTLLDKSGATVDVVGNLGAAPAWELPASENGEGRSSIIRRYAAGVPDDGTMAASWTFARDSQLTWGFNDTYYGSPDDIGTPGFRAGGPLPVSLSKFRPERLDDGSIRIAWVTESELNNAGFNILRSETKDGEFKQINTKLIAGKGTTSERSTYTYTDPSAKPNVVYYYQIQDVSMDGKVTTLRETRLKGHISAADKLTTTWGELKALQ